MVLMSGFNATMEKKMGTLFYTGAHIGLSIGVMEKKTEATI